MQWIKNAYLYCYRRTIRFCLIHSLGEVCSHVAALLFKVELAVKLGLNKISCTDEACRWNQTFRKQVRTELKASKLLCYAGYILAI